MTQLIDTSKPISSYFKIIEKSNIVDEQILLSDRTKANLKLKHLVYHIVLNESSNLNDNLFKLPIQETVGAAYLIGNRLINENGKVYYRIRLSHLYLLFSFD